MRERWCGGVREEEGRRAGERKARLGGGDLRRCGLDRLPGDDAGAGEGGGSGEVTGADAGADVAVVGGGAALAERGVTAGNGVHRGVVRRRARRVPDVGGRVGSVERAGEGAVVVRAPTHPERIPRRSGEEEHGEEECRDS